LFDIRYSMFLDSQNHIKKLPSVSSVYKDQPVKGEGIC